MKKQIFTMLTGLLIGAVLTGGSEIGRAHV